MSQHRYLRPSQQVPPHQAPQLLPAHQEVLPLEQEMDQEKQGEAENEG